MNTYLRIEIQSEYIYRNYENLFNQLITDSLNFSVHPSHCSVSERGKTSGWQEASESLSRVIHT